MKEVILRCDCGMTHFVSFAPYELEPGEDQRLGFLIVEVTEPGKRSLWQRIKTVARILWTDDSYVRCDVVLSYEKGKELAQAILAWIG